FSIVRDTWPNAWGKKPGESRLMHGAGLRSMASLMFDILDRLELAGKDLTQAEPWNQVASEIALLKPRIAWTQADADQGTQSAQKFWDTQVKNRQNTSQDIKDLTRRLKAELKDALKQQANA